MEITPLRVKKNCKKDMTGFPKYRLAVLGDCATQHLSTSLKGYAYEEGICLEVLDTDYNQILPQLLDESSELYEYSPDAILIVMCTEKLYEKYTETPDEKRTGFADRIMQEILTYWNLFMSKGQGKIIQFNFAETDDRVYGNLGAVKSFSFISQLRKLNVLLSEKAAEENVFIVDASYVKNKMGAKAFSDSKLYYSAKMPYTLEALVELSFETVQIVRALMSRIRKCVVLDLDNTLWGGVVGDDGLEGIQIGELGVGHAFQAFQQWLKELTKTGIILCVCSKNDEDKAKEPFEKHPEMILRLDDIAMFVANWEDKASNIRNIAATLNLGIDSFVFIDDNPFERDQVRTMIPEITVPDMPEDPAEYVSFLEALNLFERVSSSAADKDRTRQYREEAGRAILSQSFADYGEYLGALDMQADVQYFSDYNVPRIAQLSQRSNQFNLRTVRYTEADVKNIAESDDYIGITFALKDKFGDHGLISVVVIKKQGDTGFIENWFMSCRVLKRTMEQFIINTVVSECEKAGLTDIKAEYIRTPKNNMVADIYEKMGFEREEETTFTCDIRSYNKQKTYIE